VKIKSVRTSGFRAFAGSQQFDLHGDVVLVVGANGQGKTSLFDAVFWAIAGEIPRLAEPTSVVSVYSPSGEARVELILLTDDGTEFVVDRLFDGETDNLQVRAGDVVYRGAAAEHELMRQLWPEGLSARNSKDVLSSAFSRIVYLQQDVLTGFLMADTDQDRFNTISEFVGTGRVTDFQTSLDRSRKRWSEATNRQDDDLKEKEYRIAQLEAQLRDMDATDQEAAISQADWRNWWAEVRRFGASAGEAPPIESIDARSAIDNAMVDLRGLRASLQRREDSIQSLRLRFDELPEAPNNTDSLRREAEDAKRDLEMAEQDLAVAEQEARAMRMRQLKLRSQQEELKTLAELALRHLGERCPVCSQEYDVIATRRDLESTVESTVTADGSEEVGIDLSRLSSVVQRQAARASSTTSEFENARRQHQIRSDLLARIRDGLSELSVEVASDVEIGVVIEVALADSARDLNSLTRIETEGERFALSLAREGQLARRSEYSRELMQIKTEYSAGRARVEQRIKTRDLVSNMINGLRDASLELVQTELKQIEPMLQRIYATADPHPEFRVVRLISRMQRGRGRVVAEILDQRNQLRNEEPSVVLSSSQMNVLAVSVFLALNLGLPKLPLNAVMLDDPLQSLDDLNLLGLVDLLKRLRQRRQLILSTHDRRFASLLERKLRPVSSSERTIVVEMSGWSNEGPFVLQRDITTDSAPIRMAAA